MARLLGLGPLLWVVFSTPVSWAGVSNEHVASCTVVSFNAKKARFRCEGFKHQVLFDRNELNPAVDQRLRVDAKVRLLVDFNQFKKWAVR